MGINRNFENQLEQNVSMWNQMLEPHWCLNCIPNKNNLEMVTQVPFIPLPINSISQLDHYNEPKAKQFLFNSFNHLINYLINTCSRHGNYILVLNY